MKLATGENEIERKIHTQRHPFIHEKIIFVKIVETHCQFSSPKIHKIYYRIRFQFILILWLHILLSISLWIWIKTDSNWFDSGILWCVWCVQLWFHFDSYFDFFITSFKTIQYQFRFQYRHILMWLRCHGHSNSAKISDEKPTSNNNKIIDINQQMKCERGLLKWCGNSHCNWKIRWKLLNVVKQSFVNIQAECKNQMVHWICCTEVVHTHAYAHWMIFSVIGVYLRHRSRRFFVVFLLIFLSSFRDPTPVCMT